MTKTAVARRTLTTADYISALKILGWEFKLNECTQNIEVNNKPITDGLRAEIRSKLRDFGYHKVLVAEDAYTAEAWKSRYHPVRDYLNGLSYDGGAYITELASYFIDKYQVFPVWIRKWLIGSVARALHGEQNPMLVLDGAQGIGKSEFSKWLCPLKDYYVEAPINPDDKDCLIRLGSHWIWEVAELGATTRKADREALKAFISMEKITVRKPYAHFDINMRAMASMVGTINNESGILSDPTGSRRFLITKLESIDWKYAELDVSKIWGEAYAAYLSGEDWHLTAAETDTSKAVNEFYQIDDPLEEMLKKYFQIDPSNWTYWTSTGDILAVLETNGLHGTTTANAMALARSATKLGLRKEKKRNLKGLPIWGYAGISL